MRILIVTSVQKEHDALQGCDGEDVSIIVSGIGRTNAAVATTRSILQDGPFDAVINAGIAGVLPGSEGSGGFGLVPGDAIVGSQSIYVEEGIIAPDGFADVSALGFVLGDFEGNRVPADPALLAVAERIPDIQIAPIATVATCSGTDAAAEEVVRRTGAMAEAMEGAAVLHTAMLLGAPAIEIRAISNTTGDRDQQEWDIPMALKQLARVMNQYLRLLR